MARVENRGLGYQVHDSGDHTLDGIFRLIQLGEEDEPLEAVLTAMCGYIAKIARDSGIETVQAFFIEQKAGEIVKDHGHASLVTATNVFAHMAGLGEFLRGLSVLLAYRWGARKLNAMGELKEEWERRLTEFIVGRVEANHYRIGLLVRDNLEKLDDALVGLRPDDALGLTQAAAARWHRRTRRPPSRPADAGTVARGLPACRQPEWRAADRRARPGHGRP